MLFVLTAALLLVSPAQAGYADGMNQYAAYHVIRGGVDPMGTDSIRINNGDHPEVVNEQGEIQRSALGPTHVWTVSEPEVTGGCLPEFETQLIEYEFNWTVSGPSSGGQTLKGGYHVTVQSDIVKTEWWLNLGSGTGWYQRPSSYALWIAQQEGATAEDFRNNRDDYMRRGQEMSDQTSLARWVANSKGEASYRITIWCVCTELLEFEGLNDAVRRDDQTTIPRRNVEVATDSNTPARFLSERDMGNDPRRNSKWHMGSPNVQRGLWSPSESEGGIVWEFTDPPLSNQVKVK